MERRKPAWNDVGRPVRPVPPHAGIAVVRIKKNKVDRGHPFAGGIVAEQAKEAG